MAIRKRRRTVPPGNPHFAGWEPYINFGTAVFGTRSRHDRRQYTDAAVRVVTHVTPDIMRLR